MGSVGHQLIYIGQSGRQSVGMTELYSYVDDIHRESKNWLEKVAKKAFIGSAALGISIRKLFGRASPDGT